MIAFHLCLARGLLENAGTIVGQRSLQWDLSMLQPGLCLRIGPTSDSSSILEFVMDPSLDRGDRYLTEEPSTGAYLSTLSVINQNRFFFIINNFNRFAARILARQFVVPFLLGLKFNLVTILPLLFAGIILLLKKAMFLGKFALFITGLLGFGGLLTFGQFGGVNHHPHRPFGGGGGGLGTFGGFGQQDSFGGAGGGYYKSAEQINANFATTEKDPLYSDTFYDYEKKLLQNKSDKLFDKEPKLTSTPKTEPTARTKSYRSFVWEAA